MVRQVIAGVVLVLLFAGCSEHADPESTEGGPAQSGPVIAVEGWNSYPEAEVVDELRLVDGCLLIDDSVVFWADGTTWDAAKKAVVFETADPVRVGEVFSGGGGGYAKSNLDGLDGLEVQAVKKCLVRTRSKTAVVAAPPG